MPWFPEFGIAQEMAAEARSIKVPRDVMRSYVESAHSGTSAFKSEGTVLHDPRAGRVEGREAFEDFVRSSAKWLEECQARTEWVASHCDAGRAVGELIGHLKIDGKDRDKVCPHFRARLAPPKVGAKGKTPELDCRISKTAFAPA